MRPADAPDAVFRGPIECEVNQISRMSHADSACRPGFTAVASTNQGLTASQIRYKLILYFGNSVVEDKRRCRNARLPFTDTDRYTFQRKHAACGRGPQTYVSDTGSQRHLAFDTVLDVLLWLSNRKLFQTLALCRLWGCIGELRHPNLVCKRSAGKCRHREYRPSSHHRRAIYQSHGEF